MNEHPSNPPQVIPSLDEILASEETTASRRKPRRKESAKSLGVYDADREILDLYLHEVSQKGLLTRAQEEQVARRAMAGDLAARDELVTRNLRFVISVAKKYQNRGMTLIDLIGEGNLGLMTAARKFDPDHGVKFISYAVWWIRQSILAALARHGRTVRLPLNRTADLSRITKMAEELRRKMRREPTPEEIATETELSVEIVQALVSLNTAEMRLDSPVEAEGGRSMMDTFAADEENDLEAQVMNRFLTVEVAKALATLAPRDAKVIRLYFGLDGVKEHTLEEIGGMLGVTRERVRQLRDRALKNLGSGKVGDALASFAA